MASVLEAKKLKSGVAVEIKPPGGDVAFLASVEGGALNLPQVNVTTTKSANVEHSVGRVNYSELEVTFLNSAKTIPLLQAVAEYMNNPMKKERFTITVKEMVRGQTGAGHQITYLETFPTEIELPKGTNDAGMLTTRIRWSIHHTDAAGQTAGGVKGS